MEFKSLKAIRCISDPQITSKPLAEELASMHATIYFVLAVMTDIRSMIVQVKHLLFLLLTQSITTEGDSESNLTLVLKQFSFETNNYLCVFMGVLLCFSHHIE